MRMDGAIWAGVYGFQGKAVASRPLGALADCFRSEPTLP